MKTLNRIRNLTQKIKHLQERLKTDLNHSARRHILQALAGKKRTLRHLSKLYIWGVQ